MVRFLLLFYLPFFVFTICLRSRRVHEHKWPDIALLCRKNYSILGANACTERVFNYGKNNQNDRQNNMGEETYRCRVICSANYKVNQGLYWELVNSGEVLLKQDEDAITDITELDESSSCSEEETGDEQAQQVVVIA